jgi:hemerythrin
MAQLLSWTADLSVGIDAIDDQHKRIVDFINDLHEASLRDDRETVGRIIDALMEYTVSHFRLEEAMMERAGYRFLRAHKKVHELFTRRVTEFRHRFKLREDVAMEMQETLIKWLMNHIKNEDRNYAATVREFGQG